MQSAPSRTAWLHRLLAVLLVPLALMGCGRAEESLPYSELKARIAAGDVSEVVIAAHVIEAVPTEAARTEGAPEAWTAVPIPDDQALVPLLDRQGITYTGDQTPGTSPWLVLGLALAGGVAIVLVLQLQRRAARGGSGVARLRVRDSSSAEPDVGFPDVAGVEEAKEELRDVVEFLRDPDRFAAVGARVPKGVLLVGAPGTGKTLLARAVAGEAGVPFFSISGSEFVEVYVGVGASRVRKLFERARGKAPCIVFIDELDAAGKSRSGGPGGNDEREQTLNQLLVELDGFEPSAGIIVMAATNRPEILDPALLRPGRFDRQVLVDRPDRAGREAILEVHARRVRLAPDVDLGRVAQRTPGFVGADLANLLNEAALLAAREGKAEAGMSEIDAATDRVIAGLEKKNRLVHEKERGIVAFHEAGHAILAERAPGADPVDKVSIIPRGLGALGYMQQLPEERHLLQHDELLDRLAVLLAGRAAEQIIFGQLSTGAANDLERATDLARRMVCEFGMSERLGPVAYSPRKSGFLDASSAEGGGERSEATARAIDREVRAIVNAATERALDVLRADRDALDAVANYLLEHESMRRVELLELLGAARAA